MAEQPAPPAQRASHSRWVNLGVLIAIAAAVLGGLWALRVSGQDPAGQVSAVEIPDSGAPAPKVGEPAPTFAARSIAGDEVDLEALRGQPVWLLFNATWCANCRAEMPDVQAMHERYGNDVAIVSVFVSDTPSAVAGYSAQLGLTFPQVVDTGNQLGALYRVAGVPTHYFIAADGTLTAIDVGALSEGVMAERLQTLLG